MPAASSPSLKLKHSLPHDNFVRLLQEKAKSQPEVVYEYDQKTLIANVRYRQLMMDLLHVRVTFFPNERQISIEVVANRSPFPTELIFEELPELLKKFEAGKL